MADVGTDLSNPGELHWFVGYGPRHTTGPCPHTCAHGASAWIAYGPDLDRYTLNECLGCGCRAWFNNAHKHRSRWLAGVTPVG